MKEDKRADAIFELLGRLTTLKKPITVGGSEHPGPALDETMKFLNEKGWEVTFGWSHKQSRFAYWLQTRWENLMYRLQRQTGLTGKAKQ